MTEQVRQIKQARRTYGGQVLEALYARYNHRVFIPPDPLQFVYKYPNPADKEVVGFLSAALAFGRVRQIEKSLNELFMLMDPSPWAFVAGFGKARRERLDTFRHRFITGRDIADLLQILKVVINKKHSIESQFLTGYSHADKSIIPALSKFCESLFAIHARATGGVISRGLKYLLTDPSAGSACKRLNLFLRWMVRSDEVDPGLWKSVDKVRLIVPVDVHIGRLCKILGFYERKTLSLNTAVEITEKFARIEPNDPVKYDFALSRIGILDNCTGRRRFECEDCKLVEFCK